MHVLVLSALYYWGYSNLKYSNLNTLKSRILVYYILWYISVMYALHLYEMGEWDFIHAYCKSSYSMADKDNPLSKNSMHTGDRKSKWPLTSQNKYRLGQVDMSQDDRKNRQNTFEKDKPHYIHKHLWCSRLPISWEMFIENRNHGDLYIQNVNKFPYFIGLWRHGCISECCLISLLLCKYKPLHFDMRDDEWLFAQWFCR